MNKAVVRSYAARVSAERGSRMTLGEAEREMMEIVLRVANNMASRFTFGYHDREDMKHEGVVVALEVLAEDPPKYDATRPLENFLYIHVHHQLYNFKRKHFIRSEAPCTCCDAFGIDPGRGREPCQKWKEWARRNAAKQNIMRPIEMSRVSDPEGGEAAMSTPDTAHEEVVHADLLRKIDSGLSPDLRADYLRMREGVQIPKARRQRVREAILDILTLPDGDEGDVRANEI